MAAKALLRGKVSADEERHQSAQVSLFSDVGLSQAVRMALQEGNILSNPNVLAQVLLIL